MKFQIKNRFNGEVLFECELPPEVAGQSYSLQVGFAVKKAVEAGANLYGANLERAYLVDANLADADLAGADLADAYLAGANLARANAVIDAGVPNGWRCYGWLRDGYLSIRCGCREKRLDEAREYWSETHEEYERRREVVAALDYIEAIAKLRGWPISGPTKIGTTA